MAGSGNRSNRVRVTGARAIRAGIALAVLVATGLLAASALATSRSERRLQSLNRQVLADVNTFRAALDGSARQHSLEMGKAGYFGHASADGTVFWRRIQHYYSSADYGYWSVGENLLWGAPSVSAGGAMKLWIASPEHLRNLLSPEWRQIGISAVHVVRAPGVYHGQNVTIITTDFGVRR